MTNEEDLALLSHLGKGRKAIPNVYAQKHRYSDKYFNRSCRSSNFTDGFSHTSSLENMYHTASGKTQAIFKISSYGRGQKRILSHLCYISRRGKLELEDDNGRKIQNFKEQKIIIENWSEDFGKRTNSRDTMHLVLSTPPGSGRQKTYLSAKEFLIKEFKESGHEYLFVQHNDTDHPHIHAVIKMVSKYGLKLDPRKAYLNRVRQDYAKICRSYGIQVEASSRAERGLSGQSEKSEFVHMKRSGRKPKADIDLAIKVSVEQEQHYQPKHKSEDKMKIRNQIIRKRYADKARELHKKLQSITDLDEKTKYQKAAKKLNDYAKTMPIETTRADKLKHELNRSLNIDFDFDANRNNEITDEYQAVTLGEKNEDGIYESPTKVLSKKITAIIVEEIKKEHDQNLNIDRELDV